MTSYERKVSIYINNFMFIYVKSDKFHSYIGIKQYEARITSDSETHECFDWTINMV